MTPATVAAIQMAGGHSTLQGPLDDMLQIVGAAAETWAQLVREGLIEGIAPLSAHERRTQAMACRVIDHAARGPACDCQRYHDGPTLGARWMVTGAIKRAVE